MTRAHHAATLLAVLGAAILLAAMLFGWKYPLGNSLGIHRNLRDVAVALWAFLLPAWFVLEDAWFAPVEEIALKRFQNAQKKARLTWLVMGGAVAIIIGLTAPTISN